MAIASSLVTPAVGPNGVLLLPERPRRVGPISRGRVNRLVAALVAMVVTGTLLVVLSDSAKARAAGLSLVFPGGGLLYVAWPILFVAALVLLVLAVVLWWGISAWWGPPLVSLASGVTAVLLADGPRLFVDRGETWTAAIPIVYALAAVAVGTAMFRMERKFRRKRAKVPELNAYLASAQLPRRDRVEDQLTDFDAELLRWMYDMALQPLDQFNGFDWGEQIHGPTCVRYQLNMMGYGLAAYAANYLPNAPQPVDDALANLIEKMTDLRVWKYWRTLNLIGNLRADPDPIASDNIMLSAYVFEQIHLYEAATGSTRFDEPGSLTFVWKDGRTFPYDHHSLAATVRRNFERSDFGFFQCEPGWMFTTCNTIAAQALRGHDQRHGTDHWPAIEDGWREMVEREMMTPDGNINHIRSAIVGLSFDTGEIPGGEYFLTGTNSFKDVAPDMAVRAALLGLRGAPERIAAMRDLIVEGELQLDLDPGPERNTLITTAVPAWTRLVATARAVGELEVARAALTRMERTCGTGQRWPERPLHAGVMTLGQHMMVRWGTPMDTAALALRGYVAPKGPILRDGPWDDLLVTKATSADGVSLDVAMRPRRDTPVNATLGFDTLTPGQAYQLVMPDSVCSLTADDAGRASVDVIVAGPVEVTLHPAGAE